MKIKVSNSEKVTLKNKTEKIEEVIEVLKKGGVAIFPTDTVYGIGTLPYKKNVKRLYEIKKRDFSKKIIALVSDFEKVLEIIEEKQENIKKILKITEKYWPGQLTIVFKCNKKFTEKFDEDMDTIGVRIPKNKIALEIIKGLNGILLTTSANLSGEEAVTEVENINEQVLHKIINLIPLNIAFFLYKSFFYLNFLFALTLLNLLHKDSFVLLKKPMLKIYLYRLIIIMKLMETLLQVLLFLMSF